MQKETFPGATRIEIEKAHRSIYLRPWENEAVEIRFDADREHNAECDNGILTINTDSPLLISAPASTNVFAEYVGGNCIVYGEFAELNVEKIGGNLEIFKAEKVVIEKVGGNCVLGPIEGEVVIEKVGGNLHLDHTGSKMEVEKVGGNLTASGDLDAFSCYVGGNVKMNAEAIKGERNHLRAGGNIKLHVEPGTDFVLEAKAGGVARVQIGDESEKMLSQIIRKKFGEGTSFLSLKAGGNIRVNDAELIPLKTIEVKDFSDAAWDELEEKAEKNSVYDSSFDFSRLFHLERDIAEEVKEHTELAQERIQMAMDKLDISLNDRVSEKLKRKGLFPTEEGFDVILESGGRRRKKQGVSDEERMMILEMLQQKKISPEEADKLLQSLDKS